MVSSVAVQSAFFDFFFDFPAVGVASAFDVGAAGAEHASSLMDDPPRVDKASVSTSPKGSRARATYQLQWFHLKQDDRIVNDESLMVARYRLEQTVGSPNKDERLVIMPPTKRPSPVTRF